jgi:hemerythrin-like domain-containing protein
MTAPAPASNPATTRPSLFVFRLIHRGMRRDTAALASVVARLGRADQHTAAALRDWFVRFAAVVDQHHRMEDELLWPAVGLDFRADHDELRAAAHRVQHALDTIARPGCTVDDMQRARRVTHAFEALLEAHIERETADGFPIARSTLTLEQIIEIDNEGRRRADADLLSFLGPWLLDHATPDEIVSILERTPAPIVALGSTVWRRRYERSAKHVRHARRARTGNSGHAAMIRP